QPRAYQEGGVVDTGDANDYLTEMYRRRAWDRGELLPGMQYGGSVNNDDRDDDLLDELQRRYLYGLDDGNNGNDADVGDLSAADREDEEDLQNEDAGGNEDEDYQETAYAPSGIAAALPQAAYYPEVLPRQRTAPAPAGGLTTQLSRAIGRYEGYGV